MPTKISQNGKKRLTLFLTCFVATQWGAAALSATATLPPLSEKADVERRLNEFYRRPLNPDIMNQQVPKFSAKDGRHVSPNVGLRLRGAQPKSAILRAAQSKSTPLFKKMSCDTWQGRFSRSPCGRRSESAHGLLEAVEKKDRVERLTASFIDDVKVVHDLARIPAEGKVATIPWTDDYWRIRWAGIAYRYNSGLQYKTYKEALASFSQPKEFLATQDLPDDEAAKKINTWSPAEKYDLLIGDQKFSMTQEQRQETLDNVPKNGGDVPDWLGLCDGWSAAGLIVPAPKKTVETVSVKSLPVKWYPSDIRALTSLAWARGDYFSNFTGNRCFSENPETYPNGRIKDQDCFDTNPATFHLALGNMIGIAKRGFVMDASFDVEVWNQPVVKYRLEYFNPLNHQERSQTWSDVAVDYDDDFKANDRFQNPLTRGVREGNQYDDSEIQKIVGVIMTIEYMNEAVSVAGDNAPDDTTTRATYIYDLELRKERGRYIATGGEWQNNEHPDFFWTPKANAVASHVSDTFKAEVDLTEVPSPELVKLAAKPTANGSPLCAVVSALVEASSGKKYPVCQHQHNPPEQ